MKYSTIATMVLGLATSGAVANPVQANDIVARADQGEQSKQADQGKASTQGKQNYPGFGNGVDDDDEPDSTYGYRQPYGQNGQYRGQYDYRPNQYDNYRSNQYDNYRPNSYYGQNDQYHYPGQYNDQDYSRYQRYPYERYPYAQGRYEYPYNQYQNQQYQNQQYQNQYRGGEYGREGLGAGVYGQQKQQ